MEWKKLFAFKLRLVFVFMLGVINFACVSNASKIQVRSITQLEFNQNYEQRYHEPEAKEIIAKEVLVEGMVDGLYQTQTSVAKRQVKDFASIKTMLQGRVYFSGEQDIIQIRPMDSSKKAIDISPTEMWFKANFPEYQIIVYEGGHMSEGAFDLRTGDDTEVIGSPYDFLHSPSGKWRMSGAYNGQECHDYFLAKRGEDFLGAPTYHPVHRFEMDQFCLFSRAYWLNDSEFFVEELDPQNSGESLSIYRYSKVTMP